MLYHRLSCASAAAGIVLLAMAPNALAQQSTAATYDDWVVRCATQAGTPPQKVCDMEQLTQMQGQNTPLSRVAVGRPVKGQPTKLIIQLPVNVWIPTGVKVQMNDKDTGGLTPFTRCVPGGCFAEVEINDDLMKRFRAASEPGKIVFKNAAQQDVAIPLSFKGFGPAFDALTKG